MRISKKDLEAMSFERLIIEFKNESGLVDEANNVILASYVASSQLMGRRMAMLIKGHSSSGKSKIAELIIDAFPKDLVVPLTRVSKTAFDYYKGGVNGKCFVIKERRGIEGCQYAIDEMISSGQLTCLVTELNGSTRTSRKETRDAETSFISTTTGKFLHPEAENRQIVTYTDDSDEHRMRVRDFILCGNHRSNEERLAQLRAEIERRVTLLKSEFVESGPLMKKLLTAFKANKSRVFRDAQKCRQLLEIVCLLRTTDRGERVITLQDYYTLYVVAGHIFTFSAQKQQANYERILETARREFGPLPFSRQDLLDLLEIKEDAFNKWVRIAKKDKEFVVVKDKMGNQGETLQLNPDLQGTALPPVESLIDDDSVELTNPITGESVKLYKKEGDNELPF